MNTVDKVVKEDIAAIEAILDKCDKEKRQPTTEETSEMRFREDRIEQAKQDANKTVRSPKLSFASGGEPEFDTRGLVGGLGVPRQLFGRSRTAVNDRTMAAYIADVVQGRNFVPDESRAMALGTGALGGFAAPETWSLNYWSAVNIDSVFLPMTRTYSFEGNDILYIIKWKSNDQTLGPFGGVRGEWKPEGGTFTAVDPEIENMTLKAHKAGIFCDVTREASQNAQNLVRELNTQMVRAAVYMLDDAIINGTGIGQPLGILNADSAVDVTRALASNVSFGDIVNMYKRLYPGFVKGAAWFASPDVLGELLTLQDPASSYIWMPSEVGVGNSRPGYLLGLPLYISDKVPKLGSTGDLILANLGAYAVAVAQEVVLEKTESAKWYQDIMSFRAILRCDAAPLMGSAISPKNGGESLSWAVVLN
jgi:HK97 family phage major capsid protein